MLCSNCVKASVGQGTVLKQRKLMSERSTIAGRPKEWACGHGLVVLVPCFNEEATIAKVVADFRAALPEATIYVYDNNSTDRTIEMARDAGAVVRREVRQGK